MAQYYRKFHTLNAPSTEAAKDLHLQWINTASAGSDGPIQVSFPKEDFITPLHKAWPTTFRNLNYEVTGDPMNGRIQGAYCSPTTVQPDTRKRSYAANAYYAPISDRANLHVLTGAQVAKVIFGEAQEHGDRAAKAVRWMLSDLGGGGGQDEEAQKKSNGHTSEGEVAAKQEVIICSGSIQSPQVLELSGIGNVKHLRSLGIEPVIDNPHVGENLQDHAYCSISFEVKDGLPTVESLKEPGAMDSAIEQFKSQSGPLTSTVNCNAYMPLPEYMRGPEREQQGRGERQQQVMSLIEKYAPVEKDGEAIAGSQQTEFLKTHPSQSQQYAVLRDILADESETTIQYHLTTCQMDPHVGPGSSEWLGLKEDGNYLSIAANLSHPFSRGWVHASSKDVRSPPTLNPRYLSNPLDLEVLARHVAFAETIAATEPLAGMIKPEGRRVPPNARVGSLEKARELVRDTCVSTYHPSGSCSMLPREAGGVVDSKLKVYGTKNLRVCDASIFPLVPRGNIQTTVYAVAEKGADIILQSLAAAA